MDGWIVGLHLFSAHGGHIDPGMDLRWFTPGVQVVDPSGLTVGGYRHSTNRDTVYAGRTLRTRLKVSVFSDLTFTGAAAIGKGLYAPRVLWVPQRTQPVSLAIERRF